MGVGSHGLNMKWSELLILLEVVRKAMSEILYRNGFILGKSRQNYLLGKSFELNGTDRQVLGSFDSRDVATDGCCSSVKVFDPWGFEHLFDYLFDWTLSDQLAIYHHAVRVVASESDRLAGS